MKNREVTVSAKHLGIGSLACIALWGGYLLLGGSSQSTSPAEPKKPNYDLQKIIRSLPAENRLEIARTYLSQLSLQEKVDLLKPLLKDGLSEIVTALTPEKPVYYRPPEIVVNRYDAAQRILTLLEGK